MWHLVRAAIVRSTLVWLGFEDPVRSQDGIRADAEPDRESKARFLSAWRETFKDQPKSARDVIDAVSNAAPQGDLTELKQAILMLVYDELTTKALNSRVLRPLRDRNIGGLRIVRDNTRSKTGVLWRVEKVS